MFYTNQVNPTIDKLSGKLEPKVVNIIKKWLWASTQYAVIFIIIPYLPIFNEFF